MAALKLYSLNKPGNVVKRVILITSKYRFTVTRFQLLIIYNVCGILVWKLACLVKTLPFTFSFFRIPVNAQLLPSLFLCIRSPTNFEVFDAALCSLPYTKYI